MQKLIWVLATFGIPILGAMICAVGGVFCYRRARLQRMGPGLAALVYLAATALPVGLAAVCVKLGGYLGSRYQVYVFFGEATWALYIGMTCYLGLALLSNLVFWIALAALKSSRG